MTKGAKDAIGSMGIFCLAAVYLGAAVKLPFGNAQTPDIGYVPTVVGGLLMLLSGYSFIRGILAARRESPASDDAPAKGYFAGVAVAIAALLVYPLALAGGGFLGPSAVLTFICLRVMRYRTVAASALTAVLISGLSYVIFSVWLGVSFPDEPWR